MFQVWLPEANEDGSIVLYTKGLPFAINGAWDLLALFRCVSCKYRFSTDALKPTLMGEGTSLIKGLPFTDQHCLTYVYRAVGRVFNSGVPEMSHSVQTYDQNVYLRAAEAQRCQLHATLFMPVYGTKERDTCLGVVEVIQTEQNVLFPVLMGWLQHCLGEQSLFTSESVPMADVNVGLRKIANEWDASAFESGNVVLQQTKNAPENPPSQLPGMEQGNGVLGAGHSMPPPPPQVPMRQSGSSGAVFGDDMGTKGTESVIEPRLEPSMQALLDASAQQHTPSGRLSGKRTSQDADLPQFDSSPTVPVANLLKSASGALPVHMLPPHLVQPAVPGLPTEYGNANGKALTLQDVQSVFGYGLKEAAQKLGVAATTLKRACRRFGIPRWPRRELAKLQKQVEKASQPEVNALALQSLLQRHSNGGNSGGGSGFNHSGSGSAGRGTDCGARTVALGPSLDNYPGVTQAAPLNLHGGLHHCTPYPSYHNNSALNSTMENLINHMQQQNVESLSGHLQHILAAATLATNSGANNFPKAADSSYLRMQRMPLPPTSMLAALSNGTLDADVLAGLGLDARLESLDILAAADVEQSVGNSPLVFMPGTAAAVAGITSDMAPGRT